MPTATPITVVIDPPITEHCKECDYEAHFSFGSVHCDCPKCGAKRTIHHGRRIEQRPVRCYASTGQYNLCSSEEQTQYHFINLPEGMHQGFVIDDEDLDTSDPLELAIELQGIIDAYLMNSAKPKIKEVVAWLKENEEAQDGLRRIERIVAAKTELYKLLA